MEPYSSTVLSSTDAVNQAAQLVRGATIVSVAVVIIAAVIIVWSYKDRLHDFKALFIVFLLLAGMPFGVNLVLDKTHFYSYAMSQLVISGVSVEQLPTLQTKVTLVTNKPTRAVIEVVVGDEVSLVFPNSGTEPSTVHTFTLLATDGQFSFLINGVRFDKW